VTIPIADSGDGEHQTSVDSYRMETWLGLASIVMLFAALAVPTSFGWAAHRIGVPSVFLDSSSPTFDSACEQRDARDVEGSSRSR
jgi:hypothetical protein